MKSPALYWDVIDMFYDSKTHTDSDSFILYGERVWKGHVKIIEILKWSRLLTQIYKQFYYKSIRRKIKTFTATWFYSIDVDFDITIGG